MRVLLVEDNAADASLLQALFAMGGFRGTIDWVKDGEDALEYVFQRGAYVSTPPPDLILLDLNLPKINGREVLRLIREDAKTRPLPVIVMTTSSSDADVMISYELSARSFVTKPKDLAEYEALVRRIMAMDLVVGPKRFTPIPKPGT